MEYFDKILKWLYDNKGWIFSGIGLTGISIIGYIFKKKQYGTSMHCKWRTLVYISVNRKHIFKFVALCKLNAKHIKQLKRKTYI